MSTACQRLKSPRSLSGTSAHPTMVTLVNIMVMNGWLTSFSFHVIRPPHFWAKAIVDSDLKTPRSRTGCGQGARSYSRPSIISTHFLFISVQSDQQFLRYNYFEIWPWNIQGQGNEWGQRSRSHIIPNIQPMHFLFVSHQSDQPLLRYGQNSVWPCKNTSKIFKENLQNNSFQITAPKSNQVIIITRAKKLLIFVMIRWVILDFMVQTNKFMLIGATALTMGQGHRKVIQYIYPDPYIVCAKYIRFSSNGFDVRGKSFCGGGSGGLGGNELKT